MRVRALLLLTAVAALFGVNPARTHATSSVGPDLRILRSAAVRLGHEPSGRVLRWLGSQSAVAGAHRGRDGATIEIRFRDGQTMVVLPRRLSSVRVSPDAVRAIAQSHQRPLQSTGARAAVFEPFATELGLGPSAGAVEEQTLSDAGFRVDSAYDTSVTVALMQSLGSYNVVYMHTHSGPYGSGDGIVATGQHATGDPSVTPLIQDGSVVTVGVAGDTGAYYGLTSRFFASHVATFPKDALLVLNGCKLLPSSLFWQTLQARGAGVMVSWDEDATTQDNYLSAAGLFNFLSQGMAVQTAIDSLKAAGFGTSTYNGLTATMGFRGDGSITLSRAGHGQLVSPTSTPPPVGTPIRTAIPSPTTTQATSTPTGSIATATSVPPRGTSTAGVPAPPLSISSLVRGVAPGQRQEITVRTAPGTLVAFRVTFPNGSQVANTVTADGGGVATFSFFQPANSVTRQKKTALVAIQAGAGTSTTSVTDGYTVRFSAIDLSLQPRVAGPGSAIAIWVHTNPKTVVNVMVKAPGKKSKVLHGTTGSKGWAPLRYAVPKKVTAGSQIRVFANAHIDGKKHATKDVLTVQ